jgi:hypothetical protein
MYLPDDIFIFDDDIPQHVVDCDAGLHLELFRTFVNHGQNFGDELLLGIQITFKYRLAISEHIALLLVVGFFQKQQASLYLSEAIFNR